MNYKLIITAVSAFALGLAVQGLHAQMRRLLMCLP